ncbi:helix-turn-helix domain-containing protein [Streptomyces sp. NPDC047002]|uniref:helix-turn-helix domain-containing protein n=1 Tax=Streptomyces sp. NPDC047002 TaxID=3155475 RepID=UPI003456B59B
MLDDDETVGRRVRRQRLRLGMAQADLAAAMRRTQGWVSKVENNRVELDRTSIINELATALHCHPNDLLGRPYPVRGTESAWRAAAAAIVRELRRYDLAPVFDGVPRSSGVLWGELTALHARRDSADYTGIMERLPDLFRESRALAENSTGHEREEAFAIYAICCKTAHNAAHSLGHPELIAMACERAAWSAAASGDPMMPAVANSLRAWDMWASADWGDATALLDTSLHAIQREHARGDQLALRAWGSLQLRAAVSAARAGNAGEARHRISLARETALRIDTYAGPPVHDRHSLTFSTGNVLVHSVSVAVEMGHHAAALKEDARISRDKAAMLLSLQKSRRGHHHMDLARAWLWDGNRDRAVDELEKAERIAPQLVRNHPVARATLRRIVHAERVATRERLRRMSHRFRLDPERVFP